MTGITNASAIIGWNNIVGASAYNPTFNTGYPAPFSWTTISGDSNHTLTGLSPSTVLRFYEVQIRAVCGASYRRTPQE
ncbi:MAG: hypothetical protein IPK76_19535 [Lewinellaceae bacterium]|nr:hypothetical protein [Lewinellaceae bacterium]